MLPPKKVPEGLTREEYLKLRLRYETLGWLPQMSTCLRILTDGAHADNPEEEARFKRVALLARSSEQILLAVELRDEFLATARTFFDIGLSQADTLTDQLEPVKQVKDTIKSAFSVLSSSLQESLDTAVEKHILPAVGISTESIPRGKSPAYYLDQAEKHERLGLIESSRNLLLYVRKTHPDSPAAYTASLRLKTRLPGKRISQAVQRKYLHAVKHSLLKETETSKELYIQLIGECPEFEWSYINLSCIVLREGDLDRAHDLANKALEMNQASLRAWSNLARLQLIEWKLESMKKSVAKMQALESGNFHVKPFETILEYLEAANLSS